MLIKTLSATHIDENGITYGVNYRVGLDTWCFSIDCIEFGYNLDSDQVASYFDDVAFPLYIEVVEWIEDHPHVNYHEIYKLIQKIQQERV